MLDFAKRYGCNIHSQFGEDGIIDEILKRLKLNHGVAVEFGAPTKSYCSNTFNLDNLWQKYFFDIDPAETGIIKKEITPANVNELPKCDLLSIDIDGNDYNVWFAYKGKPKVVIIEINSSIQPTENLPVSDLKGGTCYKQMLMLGISKGYFLVCHTGNMIFVLNEYKDLFPEVIGDGFNHEIYFNTSHL